MPVDQITHRFVETNGIRMHYAEAGAGPLVVLLHGFPECWYAWRHQFGPLAAAGYRAVAPDLRGYGQTDRPEPRFRPARDPVPPSSPALVKRPPWITELDVDFLEAEFKRSGFSGGLNYYRNMDRNWALTPFLDGAKILQPSLFIAGNKDPVI